MAARTNALRACALRDERANPQSAVILFTDMVGSTRLMCSLGDALAQPVFDLHHRLLRQALAESGGREVQWLGDGMMALFDGAPAAVRCARRMRELCARQQVGGAALRIRIGLHAGELRRDSAGGYFGSSIVVARRLCDRANPDQILCSLAVVAALSGNPEFNFGKPLELRLKGIAQPFATRELSRRRAERRSSLQLKAADVEAWCAAHSA